MNALLHASVSDLWFLAGWTMVHFLWLGAIVAVMAAIARVVLRSASANVRYAVAIGSLIALAALPPATAMWLLNHLPPTPAIAAESSAAAAQISTPTPDLAAPGSARGDLATAPRTPPALALPPLSNPRQSRGLPTVTTPAPVSDSPSTLNELLESCVAYLPWLWLIGTPLTFALLVSGVVGTRRLGRSSHTIDSDPIVELLAHLASSLRITRCVTIAVCDRLASPVLIGIIRPMILLPPAALTGWSPDELEMVLLHELAHVHRWDNLVNLLQRCVESLLFFHPAVWLISSWARLEREACCDATVVARTNRPHAYAELLVALAAQLPRSVLFHPAASSAMAAGPLRSRIRQILKLEEDPMLVSGKSLALVLASLLAVVTFAVLYIPTVGRAEPSATESTEKGQGETATVRHAKSESDSTAEFPYQVQFETGVSKFVDGDDITINEIRGTAKEITPGNNYQIKGRYKLHSHPSASLSAFTTAKEAKDGTGPVQSIQTKNISQGDADFTIVLPMTIRGWPHLSFYAGGESVGGVYFGTGDTVLKDDAKDEQRTRFEHFEKSLKTIELVIAVFNDSAGYSHQLEPVYQNLIKDHHSLDLWGSKVDPKSPDAERYHLTGAPTCIVFRNGQEISRLAPIKDAEQLKRFIEIAAGARKVTVKPDGSMLAEGLESYRATPQVAESEKHGALKSSSKFPSLEEQKLADLAYKRLGLEVEPIEEADLSRVKALGYDGGVRVVSGSAGLGNNNIIADDILVGLGVWPTTNMKAIGEVLTRPEIAELNPVKFYVVRAKDLAASRGGAPDIHDILQTGRVEIQNAGSPEAGYSTAAPTTGVAGLAPRYPGAIPAGVVNELPVQTLQAKVVQPNADANPYAAPSTAVVPSPHANNVADASKRLEEALKRKTEAMEKRTAAKTDEEVEKAKRDLGAANKQLEEAKRQREELKRQPQLLESQSSDQPNNGWTVRTRTAPDGKAIYESEAAYPSGIAPPPVSTAVVPTPLTASQNMMTSASLNLFTASAQRLEEAVLRKSEAMEKRLAAKSDEEIEKSKHDLDAANKQLEEAKRQFEEAKRQREKLDTENQLKEIYKQRANRQSATTSSLPASWPAVPTRVDSSWSQSVQGAPADETSTPEQILTEPTSPSATVSSPEKVDSLRVVAAQSHPTDAPILQATLKDTPTTDTHPTPSVDPHHNDNSADVQNRRSTRTDANHPRSSRQSAANASETPSDDRILVAYDIPAELVDDVKRSRDALPDTHGEFGNGGRYYVQATAQHQKRFQELLDATPKWRDAEKVKSRAKQVYVKTQKDGQDYLEWQPAGLTFTSRTNSKFAPPASGGGGWAPNGVVVADVAPGSPADWNGIEPGDVMTNTGRFETKNLVEIESLLKTQGQDYSTKSVQCLIHRGRPERGSFYAQLYLAVTDAQPKPSGPISDPPMVQAQMTNAHKTATSPPAASTEKSALRYDGKTFDQWREMLTNELSTEKRLEAVKALAAFGRAGYAKEASQAILDIASEYDFYIMQDGPSPEATLKDIVVNELAPESRTQSMAKYWAPDLVGRLANDAQKWKWLAYRLLEKLKTDDAATIAAIEPIAKNADVDLRSVALRAITTSDHVRESGKLNDKTQQLLASALQSKDPTEVAAALNSLLYTPPGGGTQSDFNPALATLVFDPNSNVQLAARNVIKWLPKEEDAKLVDKYTAVLKDASRKADRVAAIRALSAMGTAAEPAVTQLEHIFPDENQDLPSRVAAAFAIDQIEGGVRCQQLMQNIENSTTDEKMKTRLTNLSNEERQLQNR